jgi:hypothetical protein
MGIPYLYDATASALLCDKRSIFIVPGLNVVRSDELVIPQKIKVIIRHLISPAPIPTRAGNQSAPVIHRPH